MEPAPQVVVPAFLVHWNAPDWCERSAVSLRNSSGVAVPVTIINNSPEIRFTDLPDDVLVHESGCNLGFAAGANLGLDLAAAAGAGHVLIGCHDVEVEPDAVFQMLRMLERDPGLGIVGPVINDWDSGGDDLEYVSGTLMLLRDEVAKSMRFDARFGSYVEDVDFCIRARRARPPWRVGRCAQAHVRARGSVDATIATTLIEANGLALVIRHHLWRQVPRRIARLVRHKRWQDLRLAARQTVRLYKPLQSPEADTDPPKRSR